MTTDLYKSLVETTSEQADAARPPASGPRQGSGPVIEPHDAPPLDWDQAVDAAAARLEEAWVRPDSTGHMVASGLAGEFAAMLCAYGMVAAEVAHMRDHDDKLPSDLEATLK
jgi:hypothetical protein